MDTVLIIVIVLSILLGIFLFVLLLGSIIVFRANYYKFTRKQTKKYEGMSNPEFEFQLDREWFFQDKFFNYLTIGSYDKKEISAYLHLESNSHMYLVYCHGFCGFPWEKSRCLKDIYDKYHCNILALEQRGQNNSNIHYCTMGYKEGKDLVSWTNYIAKMDKEAKIVVYGQSMGAATVLYGLEYGYNKNVLMAIEDCGFSSISKVYDYTGRQYTPSIVSKIGVFGTIMAFFLITHIRVVKYTPLKSIKKKTIPVCFIHGQSDQIVPFECFKLFKENINKDTDSVFESFENATHACSYYYNREKYLDIIFLFIDKRIF